MENQEVIRSRSNALLKRAGAAVSGKTPGVMVLEGDRLVDDAVAAGYGLEVVLVSAQREDRARELEAADLEVRRVEHELLARISSLETSPGVMALAVCPDGSELSALGPAEHPRTLVVAGLQDPGNLGALARTAEAAGFTALVTVRGGARCFGPKALRGSMGSLLRLAIWEVDSAEEIAGHLESHGVRQVCAVTRGGTDWRAFSWSPPLAIWVTGETGTSPAIMTDFEGVSIPMAGAVESLNVTVATSLLLFAAGGGA